MKPRKGFFARINSWPEEARQIMAAILFLLSALALFGLWNFGITAQLNDFPEENLKTKTAEENYYETETLTPFAGITETFRSLEVLFKP